MKKTYLILAVFWLICMLSINPKQIPNKTVIKIDRVITERTDSTNDKTAKASDYDYRDDEPWVVNTHTFPSRYDAIPADQWKRNQSSDPYQPIILSPEWGNLNNLSMYPLNSAGAEDSPYISPDGKSFYFYYKANMSQSVYEEILEPTSGIYMSNWIESENNWTDPVKLGLMGEDYPYNMSLDGAAWTYDDETMVFASTRVGMTGQFDIFYTKRVNGQWAIGHNMGMPPNTIDPGYAGEHHLTPDGKTMYYNYVGPNGWGLNNISVSHYNDITGTWSAPEQMEGPINNWTTYNGGRTAGQPFLSYDGNEFWFTGNSTSGAGPSIYCCKKQGNGWGTPEEIVKNFAGEPNLTPDGKYLYFIHHYVTWTPDFKIYEADIYRIERLTPRQNLPIFINGTDSLNDWTACDNVTGTGAWNDPFLLKDLIITGYGFGSSLTIIHSNKYFRIENCTISQGGYLDSHAGLYLENVSHGVLVNCTYIDNGNAGILMKNCSNITIQSNNLTFNRKVGTYLANSYNFTILTNNLTGGERGFHLNRCFNMSLMGNLMIDCSINIENGYVKSEVTSFSIDTSNKVNGKSVYYFKNVNTLGDSDFIDPGQIILANCNMSLIRNFNFANASNGISLLWSSYNTIQNCSFSNLSYFAIHGSYYCDHNIISLCKITKGGVGIVFEVGSYNSIFQNQLTQGIMGVFLAGSPWNSLQLNTFEYILSYGLWLYLAANNNTITNNTFRNCSNYALYIPSTPGFSESNAIYYNYFYNNNVPSKQTLDDGNFNQWDNGALGNYWSDYSGIDKNDNGIGDTAMSISGAIVNQDYFPIWNDGKDVFIKPQVTSPPDIEYLEGSTGNVIIWTVTDSETNDGNYTLFQNDTQKYTGTWISGLALNYTVDGLTLGVYNFSIIAYDNHSQQVQDSVIVSVIKSIQNPGIDGYTSSLMVTVGIVVSYAISHKLRKNLKKIVI